MRTKSFQLCPTLCDPMVWSSPGSSVQAWSRVGWSGLPFPSPGNLPKPGIEPGSLTLPALAGGFLTTQFSSIQSLSRVWLFATPWTAARQTSRPSPTPGAYPNSCPLSWWCHPAISSSVVPFSSCPQSLPASGSFPMSQLFPWGGQSSGISASALVLSMNTQDWSPLGWTGWISLQSLPLVISLI